MAPTRWRAQRTGIRPLRWRLIRYVCRYRCKQLALFYPASGDCPPGKITEIVLMTEERPMLEVVAVDVRELACSGIPAGIVGMNPIERHWKQRSLQAPSYEAV
jgi:5-methylcytosine-specific restriction enzyme subunit McrC